MVREAYRTRDDQARRVRGTSACMEEICSARRLVVVQLFLEALTRGSCADSSVRAPPAASRRSLLTCTRPPSLRMSGADTGGPGGTPRPIELHAHDPMRYVSDMLAWLHQAMASERELLEGLVGKAAASTTATLRSTPESPGASASASESEFDLAAALDKVAEGTGRPLRVRVEQLLAAGLGPLVAFRLSHLLHFYGQTLARLLGPQNRLALTVAEYVARPGRGAATAPGRSQPSAGLAGAPRPHVRTAGCGPPRKRSSLTPSAP